VKVTIYARVSTDAQSHDSQLQEVRRYCERRGWVAVSEVIDTASGVKTSRSGLDRLMAAVRRGKVDVVVVFKLDRLGRSLAHLAQLIAEFQTHGVALVCTSQGIDTTNQNPAAQLQLNILCAVAEFERAIIKERVCAGIAAARSRGVTLGRPSTLKRHEKAVAELLRDGLGVCAISRKLRIPLSSTHKVIETLRQRHLRLAAGK
jgi:DNA invertase Pin-like site-specific DNA recombinase